MNFTSFNNNDLILTTWQTCCKLVQYVITRGPGETQLRSEGFKHFFKEKLFNCIWFGDISKCSSKQIDSRRIKMQLNADNLTNSTEIDGQ